jgi:uncharacterized protein (DUF488 family)
MDTREHIGIYTLGHSNHPWDVFAALLQGAQISAIADVRTYPRSRFAHFNQSALRQRLSVLGIAYQYFGDALGGRPSLTAKEANILADDAISGANAITAVANLAAKQRTALLCSEHDPLDCHRFTLLAWKFEERGIEVFHVMRDGRIELNEATKSRGLRPRAARSK